MMSLIICFRWNVLSVETPENKHLQDCPSLKKDLEHTQILVAGDDDELLWLFSTYLSSIGITTEMASSSEAVLDCFVDSMEKGRPYDAILLDTHLSNPSGLDVAKRIHLENPDQKMVIVTTTPVQYLLQDCIKTAGIEAKDILTMLFRMSEIMAALRS